MGVFSGRAWFAALALAAAASAEARPRVGLVLSGGGAKGFAHIGVIQVLEEAGVPVDLVVGTSMGAVVGGLYASGYSGPALQTVVGEIDWGEVFVDATPRRDLSIRRKADDYGFLADPRLRLRKGSPALPRGVVAGQRLMLVLRRLGLPAAGVEDFDDLPIPFRAVAADLETGEAVVFADGDLPVAMRASMAVPGVFPPVDLGERSLVDGGVVDNLPVSVARAMGADVVIVSAFAERPVDAEDVDSAVAVLGRMVDMMILRRTREEIRSVGPGDVLVVTDLGPIGSTSFDRAPEAIALGAAAARGQLAHLAALAAPARPAGPRDSVEGRPIRRIIFHQDTPLDDDVLRARMDTAPGDRFDVDRLNDDAASIYGLELFETVTWRVTAAEAGEAVDVEIRARAASEGLTYVRFGLELATDVDRGATFTLGTSVTAAPLNALNGEWRTELSLGRRYGVTTELYQPLDPAARLFVAPALRFSDQGRALFDDLEPMSDVRVVDASGRLAAGVNVSDDLALAAVAEAGWGHVREVAGAGGLPARGFRTATVGGTLVYDDIDDLNFPRRGAIVGARYLRAVPALGAAAPFDAVRFRGNVAAGAGRHAVVLGQTANVALDGDLDPVHRFELGGPFNLSGLLPGALSGDVALLSRLVYQFEWGRAGAPPFELSYYLGATLEYGGVFDDPASVRAGDLRLGGNVFAAADAYVGPVYLGYGYTEGGGGAVFLSIGGLY